MKYCERPFKHVYIMPNGNVFLCSWTTKPIGNLLEQGLEEIWNSPMAEDIRESIKDNSFCYCKTTGCPFCENDTLLVMDEKTEYDKIQELCRPLEQPVQFNCAIDFTCNHSCPSCRNEIFVPDEQYKKNMDIIVDKILPYLSKAEYISTDGQGDCFASPKVMRMLEKLNLENANTRLTLETNGVLFDEEHWKRIKHLSNTYIRVVVTPNSFERATYKYLTGGHDNLDKMIKNLHFIRSLREQNLINDFAISIVVQDRNFRELPAFCQRCFDEFHVDSVTVKPIYRWFKLREDEYLQKDILNPCHPYYEEYQEVWKDERLKDPRIYWWGSKNIHPRKILPADKYYKLFDVAAKMFEMVAEDAKNIEKRLREKGYNQIAIYGYGRMGKIIYRNLKEITKVIVDKRNLCIDANVEFVLASADVYPEVDLIIVTPFYEFDSIVDNIKEKTNAKIISLEELIEVINAD